MVPKWMYVGNFFPQSFLAALTEKPQLWSWRDCYLGLTWSATFNTQVLITETETWCIHVRGEHAKCQFSFMINCWTTFCTHNKCFAYTHDLTSGYWCTRVTFRGLTELISKMSYTHTFPLWQIVANRRQSSMGLVLLVSVLSGEKVFQWTKNHDAA